VVALLVVAWTMGCLFIILKNSTLSMLHRNMRHLGVDVILLKWITEKYAGEVIKHLKLRKK
jgi:hypothetical protein